MNVSLGRSIIYRLAVPLAILAADPACAADLSAPGRAAPTASSPHTRTLREVLASVEAATGVQIIVEPDVADVQVVDVAIAGRQPEAVLRQILAGYEVLMQYLPGQGNAALSLKRVWVRMPGPDADARPADAAADSAAVPGGQPSPEHPAATGAAVDEAAPDAVAQRARDLTDADENVRQRALVAAAGSGDPLPRHMLEQLLISDPSALVRRSALEALNAHPEVDQELLRAYLERARRDSSPLVRDSAAAIAAAKDAPVDNDPTNAPGTDAAESPQPPDAGAPSSAGQ